jgi:D-methionine transport system ATP-binding protein
MSFIEFKDVNKTFSLGGQSVEALKDVNLSIEKGDIFGVIGFSGAGKSTLLRMVNSLEVPTSGSVFVHGQNVSALPYKELRKVRKNIGMVFQQFNLLESKTVYENIALPLRLSHIEQAAIDQIVTTLLKFVNLEDKKDSYPDQLSGGQKQRVGIARALTTNPSILLCDEATSALDPDTTEQILQLLKRINQKLNITILIVTHEIDVIQKICNRVAVMELGRIVECGSVLDVFSDPQQEITKRFVHTVIPDTVPEAIQSHIKEEKRPYKLFKVRLLGDEAAEDIFYHMNAELGIETHIVFANVSELQQTALGIYIIQVIDENGATDKASAYLTQREVKWKEVTL